MTSTDDAAEQTSGKPTRRPGLLFRNRDYTGWWLGETVSEFGSALSVVAYPLLVLAVTGSAAGAGAVEAAANIGFLVTLLIGGALADRFSRRTIMLAGPLVQAVAVSTVVVAVALDRVTVPHIAAVGFVQGLAGGLSGGAEFAALRRVVPEHQLPTAFALMQGRTMAIRLAGPSAGGFLFGIARAVPFLVDVLSFLVSAVGVLLIRRPLGPDLDEHEPREPVLASIAGGFRFIRGHAYLRFMTVWIALANACNGGLFLLVVVLVHNRGGSAVLVGAVTSLGAVGGLAGSLLSGWITRRVPGRLLAIASSWLTAAVAVGIAFAPHPWLIGGLMSLMMFLAGPINVVLATYEARTIPDALMGRVSSAINFGAWSIRWLGALGAGVLASAFGPVAATTVFAGVLALIAVSTMVAKGLYVLNRPIDEVTSG
ncbi:MFS transporter [Nonomuraea sp. NPDC005650]|uniref:MFS transporter n=1 Tax=Nonomuraea sp. NPDC005650 TaxID=3157045 RepID=UPI0033B58797